MGDPAPPGGVFEGKPTPLPWGGVSGDAADLAPTTASSAEGVGVAVGEAFGRVMAERRSISGRSGVGTLDLVFGLRR